MTSEEKKYLVDLLTKTHTAIRADLEGIDLETRVYADTEWRIRDIIGHIATWDREASKSLHAFSKGTEYSIPDLDEDSFNEQAVLEQRGFTDEEILTEWEQAREEFILAIQDMPLDLFPGDLLFPWGDECGSIAQLAEFLCEHDIEHRDEIAEAILGSHAA
jgi:hypothetical protein